MTKTLTAAPAGDVVARAKTMAKAEALFGLDCGSKGLASAMTAAVLEGGSFTNAAAVAASYDAITASDVSSAISAVLKTKLSLAALGDIGVLPYQGTFASHFS
jgi:predicted Zn-dependent peptidase